MESAKRFIDYKFTGIKPFTETLEENSIEYILFDESREAGRIFDECGDILNRNDDIIETGKCLNNDIEVYFAQFGIKITKSYRSYVVFIYNRHPLYEDLLSAAESLEMIITEKISNVDISSLTASG